MRTLLVGIRKVKEFGSVALHKFLNYRDFIEKPDFFALILTVNGSQTLESREFSLA